MKYRFVFMRILPVVLVGLFGAEKVAAVPVLSFFPSTAYNANTATMDAALGTSGRPAGNFEATPFLTGLTIVLSGGVATTTEMSLPALFDGNTFSPYTQDAFWDGSHTASNAIGNLPNSINAPTNIANRITLNYAPGTLSFGIGMGSFQSTDSPGGFGVTQHELIVNGAAVGVLETLAGANWTPGLGRNAYLRIDSDVPITSVAFENLVQPPSQQDFLMFDHLTVAVPEADTSALFGVGLAAMVARFGRRRTQATR